MSVLPVALLKVHLEEKILLEDSVLLSNRLLLFVLSAHEPICIKSWHRVLGHSG